MLTKKLTLGIMAALYGAGTAYATEPTNPYIYKPFGLKPLSQAVVPDWEKKNSEYTAWQNEGAVYNCLAWSPPENVVNLDEEFTQSRECSQSQSRTRTDEMYSQRLDQTRYEGPFGESRVITVEESQGSVGTRDYITGEREDAYPNWSKVGGFYGCGSWSPDPSEINYGATFTQERDCSWDEDRQRNVFNTWQSGRETYNRTDSEGRTVPHTDSRESTGTYRDWQPTSSTYTAWEDVGTEHSHTSWSPAPSTQPSDFTQSREYKRDQERYEQKREQDQVTDDYRNTGSPVLHEQTVDRSEDRDVTVDYTSWEEVNRSAYTSWSPAPTTQTESYNQTRNYTLTEERERSYTAAGDGELLTATESRDTVEQTETRPVSVSFSEWSNSGAIKNCGGWSPAENTVAYNESYTQTRECDQDQVRNRAYSADGSELNTFVENRTVKVNDAQNATGTGNWVAHASTFTSWINSGGRHTYSSYSPTPTTQTTTFSQSRSYKQNQTRNEQKRERDTIGGSIRNVGSPIARSQTINGSESRNVTVAWSSWSNSGGKYSCGAYNNPHGNQTASYTQTRVCKQNQTRTRTYSSGESFSESKVINSNDSRTVTVTVGGWSNTSTSGHSSWSLAASSQTSNYSQSRSYTQTQRRVWTHKVASTTVHTRNEDRNLTGQSQSRSITVTNAAGSYGSTYGWTSWSPTPTSQTATFTQTRGYKRDRTRTYTHKSGTTTIHTRGVTETGNFSQSRNVTVSWSSWANSGGKYSCGSYNNPYGNQTASYTQTRVCKQNQTRTRTYSSGESFSESKVINSNDSRTVTVTVGGWSNTSTSGHSSWSLAASSQTSNYSQSRSYTQTQRRVWTHKVASTTVHTRNEDRNLTGQSQSRSITVTNAAGSYGSTYGWTSWTPAASAQTSNFSQTRSYKRNRTRTYTHKSGTTTIHTRGVTETSNFSQSRSVVVSWSTWVNNGTATCGNWAKDSRTGAKTRSCSQPEKRTRTYKVGTSTIHSATETRNRSYSETITVTGTTYGSWSGYSNQGAPYSCSSYSPATSTVNSGATFTQSRSCKQNQRRQRSKYTNYSDGSRDYVGIDYGTRITTVYQTKQATGTKVTTTCSSNSYNYAHDEYTRGGEECEADTEKWTFNGQTIYDSSLDSCRGGEAFSPGTWSGQQAYDYAGYRYTLKNVVTYRNYGYGDVCRTPL